MLSRDQRALLNTSRQRLKPTGCSRPPCAARAWAGGTRGLGLAPGSDTPRTGRAPAAKLARLTEPEPAPVDERSGRDQEERTCAARSRPRCARSAYAIQRSSSGALRLTSQPRSSRHFRRLSVRAMSLSAAAANGSNHSDLRSPPSTCIGLLTCAYDLYRPSCH